MHAGFGVEGFANRRVAIGGELGYLTPWRGMGDGIGLFSLNGSYNFLRERRMSPFVTGGYSLAFRSGHLNMVNLGGGVNMWLGRGIGIRLEARDHLAPEYADTHCLSFRIGFLFR
jgi:hypothetical protein